MDGPSTLKTWLRAQPQPTTLAELQTLLDIFAELYNTHRPHSSLPQRSTSAVAYRARPKATPAESDPNIHSRVRHDRVANGGNVTLRVDGQLHHIALSRALTGTRIILLIADLDIRIINAATGELYRHLTLDPTRRYHGTGRPPGPPPRNHNNPNPKCRFGLSGMS